MKFLRIFSTALVLLLGAVIAHAQGFEQKSFPMGVGKPEMKYHLLLPDGVTVTNMKGEVFKGGQVVVVPGANVTVLESAYAKVQMKDAAFKSSFVNEQQFVGMSEEKVRDFAVVSVKVPDGVTVEGYGKTIKGPSQVTLMVTNKGSQMSPDTLSADSWKSMGGWSGWNK